MQNKYEIENEEEKIAWEEMEQTLPKSTLEKLDEVIKRNPVRSEISERALDRLDYQNDPFN